MRWYSLLNKGEESLLRKMDISETKIPVCNEGKGYKQFGVFRGPLELYDFCINEHDDVRCLFEIIQGFRYQKIYFDIDIDLDGESKFFNHSREQRINIANQIPHFLRDCIIKTRPEVKDTDIMIFSSNSVNKRSYHFVVDRWCVRNAKQNRKFFESILAIIPVPWKQYFDSSMYKSIQQFRLYMSTKYGKGRMKILDPKYSTWVPDEGISITECNRQVFLSSLITRTDNCYILPIEEEEEEEVEYDMIDIDDEQAVKIYSLIKSMPYAGCFCITERKNNLVVMKRIMPSFCTVCQSTHDNENPCVVVSPNGNVNLDCRRHSERKRLLLGNVFDDCFETKEKDKLLDTEAIEVPFFEARALLKEDVSPISVSPISVSPISVSPISVASVNIIEKKKEKPNKYEQKGLDLLEKRKKRNKMDNIFTSLF